VDPNANLLIREGLDVEIGFRNDVECILRASVEGALENSISPYQFNPLDEVSNALKPQEYFMPFYFCRYVDSDPDDPQPLTISVAPTMLRVDGQLQEGGRAKIAVGTLVPAAGLQCWAVVFWNTTGQILTAYASTEVDIEPIDVIAALQECYDQAGDDERSICGVYLSDDQEALDDDKNHWIDLREVINIPSGGGAGTVTSVAESTDASYLTVGGSPITTAGTITINKTDGLTANQVVATPNGAPGKADLRALVAADLPNTAVTPGSYAYMSGTVDAQGRLTAASSGIAPRNTAYWRQNARLCTDVAISVTSAPATIDGVTAVTGDRILVRNQSNPNRPQNGLWVYQGAGNAMTRPTDYAAGSTTDAYKGIMVYIEEGATQKQFVFILVTAGAITIDSTITTWDNAGIVSALGVQDVSNKSFGASIFYDGTTINANQGLNDTTIKGTSDASLFVADGSADRIGIGAATPSAKLNVEGSVIINDLGADVDVRIEGDTDANLFFTDASTDRVGVGTNTPTAKLNVEGGIIINDTGADVDVRIESDTDADNFFSDGGNNNIGIGTGTPNAAAKLEVVSTTKGSIPAPVMTVAQRDAISSPPTGLQVFSSDDLENYIYDSQRYRGVGAIGWLPFAFQYYPTFFGTLTTGGVNLPANGGSAAIPILLSSHMLLQSVSVINTNTNLARKWRWDLYIEDLNNGNAGENNLRRIAACTADESFTATAASKRTIAAASAPVYLPPGLYWLAIQATDTSNLFTLKSTTSADPLFTTSSWVQTKTTTNPNGATLDFVAATWTKNDNLFGVRLNGRVFGETAAF